MGVFLAGSTPNQCLLDSHVASYLLHNTHDHIQIKSWKSSAEMSDIIAKSHYRHEIVAPSPFVTDLGDMESESEEQSGSEDEDAQHSSFFSLETAPFSFVVIQHLTPSYRDVSPIVAVNYLYLLFHALIFYE